MKVDLSKNTWMLLLIVSSWALGTGVCVQQEALLSPKAELAARKKGRNTYLHFSAKKKKKEENKPQIINIITHNEGAVAGMG